MNAFLNLQSMPILFQRLTILLFVSLLPGFLVIAQPVPNRYNIEAELNDSSHHLKGVVNLHYSNIGFDTLYSLVFQIWPNAYQNRQSSYARQQLELRRTTFHFSSQEQRGGYDSLAFLINGSALTYQEYKGQIDIVEVNLQEPLYPGDTVSLEIPFDLVIPELFSDFGHTGHYYQCINWFPILAIRDSNGWDARPLVELGEVRLPLSHFDVTIRLPANYIVAASGQLESLSERVFLDERIQYTTRLLNEGVPVDEPQIQSSDSIKAVRYTAQGVPSFSWCAAKDFYVLEELSGPDSVGCQVFFSNREIQYWRFGARHLKRAMEYVTALLGPYPYPVMAAVESRKRGSFGLEKPMMAFLGSVSSDEEFDGLLAYELSRQWFYSTTACDYQWLAEGLSACYESRYVNKYYEKQQNEDREPTLPVMSRELADEAAYLFLARRKGERASDAPAPVKSGISYFVSTQAKPAIGFRLLERYLGEAVIDSVVRSTLLSADGLCEESLRMQMDSISTLNTDWFFDGFMGSQRSVDYAITKVQRGESGTGVVIKNKGSLAVPFQLSAVRDGRVVYETWIEGTSEEWTGRVPVATYDRLVIDPGNLLPDLYRSSNSRLGPSLGSRLKPPRIRFLSGFDQEGRKGLFWAPVVGWNNYQKSMAGVLLYNRAIVPRKVEWAAMPLIGGFFDRLDLVGMGEIHWHLYKPAKAVQRISPGLGIRSFSIDYLPKEGRTLRYVRLSPRFHIELARPSDSEIRQSLEFRLLAVSREVPQYADGLFQRVRMETQWIPQLEYKYEDRSLLTPFSLVLMAEQQDIQVNGLPGNYIKVSAEMMLSHLYAPGKHWNIRVFGGYFTSNSFRNEATPIPQAFTLASQGFNDYTFARQFIGRSETSGMWASQIAVADGGMKVAPLTGSGQSNRGILAINLQSDLPLRLPWFFPLSAYFDVGIADNPHNDVHSNVLWSGGFSLRFARDAFGIYLPLVQAQPIRDSYKANNQNGLFSRLTFSLDLARLHPWKLIDDLEL
jgi:hypothetical protein